MQFNETLRKLRREKDLTQNELAEKLGKTRGLVAQLESGLVEPTISNLEKLADVFGTDIYHLITGKPLGSASDRALQGLKLTPVDGELDALRKENSSLKIENKELLNKVNELQSKIIELQDKVINLG